MSVEAALARLLAGTGLFARQVGPTAWRIERAAAHPLAPEGPVPPQASRMEALPQVVEGEPIIVTAPKRSTTLDKLPMAISVLRLDPVQAALPAGGTMLVATQSEGLAMTLLGPGRNRLFLRGVADSPFNGESQSTVAVVLNDTRLTYAAPDPDIQLVDVERVEVLKGPQGSLYGSGALGGIYHIVTREADPKETTLQVAAKGEGAAHGSLGWSSAAIGNLPLARGTSALRLVGYTARAPGWIDTGSRRNSNETRLLGGRANLGVEPGGGWRLDVSGLLQLLESRDSSYVYAPGARKRPAQLPEPHDNDMRHISARVMRKGGPFDISLSTGVTWHEVRDTLDATAGAGSFGLASPSLLADERLYRVWDNEARIAGRAGKVRWLLGLSYLEARQQALSTLGSFTGAASVIDRDLRYARDAALFGDLTLPLGRNFSLDAGARLFRSITVEKSLLADGPVSRRRHRSGMTPSLALSWQPSAGHILYLRYASAYRQGSSDINPAGALEALKSDELQTIEMGWRRDLGQGRRMELGLFASRWSNLQSDQLLPSGLIETVNAGNARIFGAEASLELPLGSATQLEAGASLTEALLTRNTLGKHLDDRRLPVVPRYTARMALARRVPLGWAEGNVRLSLRHVGPQRLSFDPIIDRPMGSYFEGRIDAHVEINRLRVFFTAENLLGGSKDSFAFGNSLRFSAVREYTPQRPACVTLGMVLAI